MANDNEILWTAGFFNERFPAPVSPLGWSLHGPLIEEIALRDPLRYLGYPEAETLRLTRQWRGHPYTNVRTFQIFYKVFPDFLVPEDAYRYFPEGDVSLRRLAPYPSSILSPRFLFSMTRAFLRDPGNFSPLHNYRTWEHYAREHDATVNLLRARLPQLGTAKAPAIFQALSEAEEMHCRFLRIHRWSLMHADLTFGLLKRLARAWVDPEHGAEIAARLTAGAPNLTLQVDAELGDLAERTRHKLPLAPNWDEFAHSALPEVLEALEAFISRHGHRSFSLDIAVPTFADDPMQVVRLLQVMETHHDTGGAAETPARLSGPKQAIFNAVRSRAVQYVAMRENQRYYWQKSLALSRHLYLILADRLVAQRVIEKREQVFFATHAELADYFEGKEQFLGPTILSRQAEWAGYVEESRMSPASAYPAFLRGDTPLITEHARRQSWQGRAISPGKVRGAARIVRSAQELKQVQQGEILIAPSTDPAWTPVFAKLSGVVLERGGVLSHGAVIAREYRIPAVAGIANIVSELADGELIQVDGNLGTVERVSGK